MFGFVDFRRSPVIRLFPSVADAHQTSAFRAWTMGEPYIMLNIDRVFDPGYYIVVRHVQCIHGALVMLTLMVTSTFAAALTLTAP